VIVWIESQPPGIIALIVFGGSYLVSALILLAAIWLSSRRVAADLKATTPSMLTPLSLIAGLIILFLATRVWDTVDRASAEVTQEVSAIQQTFAGTEGLPPETRDAVRGALHRYIQSVVSTEWPAMEAGKLNLSNRPTALVDALDVTYGFKPAGQGELTAQQRVLNALENTLTARTARIRLSESTIAPIQWQLMFLLLVLILIIIALVHIDRWLTVLVNLALFATAFAACIALLMIHDRPFSSGGFTLKPNAFQEIVQNN
jgi:hypothetical protein